MLARAEPLASDAIPRPPAPVLEQGEDVYLRVAELRARQRQPRPSDQQPQAPAPAPAAAPSQRTVASAARVQGAAGSLPGATVAAAAGPLAPAAATVALVGKAAASSGNAAAGRVAARETQMPSPAAPGWRSAVAPTPGRGAARTRSLAGPASQPGGAPTAAPGGGVGGLDAWKASVGAATQAIAPAKLDAVIASPAKVKQAGETAQQRSTQRKDPAQELRERLPLQPQSPPPEKQLDTKEADTALRSVTDVISNVKLADQTFPARAPMPGDLATRIPPPPPVPPATETVTGAPATPGPVQGDPKAQAVAGKVAGVAPVSAQKAPSGPINVSDPGAASLEPLPPAQATQIGDVAARVIANAPTFTDQIVGSASARVDPRHLVEGVTAIGKRLHDGEQNALIAELEGIAAAAGVSGEALKAKVAAQAAAASQQAAAAGNDLTNQADAAKASTKQQGEEDQQKTAGAAAAAKTEVARKTEAVKGASDPTVVNQRRDDYLGQVGAGVAGGGARLHSAIDKRKADLQRIGSEQKADYMREAQEGAARIQAAASDPTAGRIAARPLLDWATQQGLEVDATVARLAREAQADEDGQIARIATAATAAREQIRDWAAHQAGRDRSWWERLWDIFSDWRNQADADAKAWEAQRNADTRDKVAADFTMLAKLHDELASGNREQVAAELTRMSAEQQLVVLEFFRSGGKDAIGAVAAGLAARLATERVPELSKQIEDAAIAELGWEQLNTLGREQTPGFDAGLLVRDVRGAVEGWGTDEKRLFKALGGHTPLQIAAMRKAYKAVYPDRDMDEDINDDLSGSELERADALRSGDPVAGAVATLHDAMDGIGTDEDLIFQTLRGKTPAERDAIVNAYKEKYGVTLQSDLDDEMSGNDLAQANALLAGETSKADAIAINDKFGFFHDDTDGIQAVYARIRDEVEAKADREGMTTAEVEAEIKRRTGELQQNYGEVYGEGGQDSGKLEQDYREHLSGGDLNLALASQAVDQTAIDAAKIQVEHESLWTSDDKVNEILKSQYTRSEKELRRDLMVDFNKRAADMTPEQRAVAREQIEQRIKAEAPERAKQNMDALTRTYDANNYGGAFDDVIKYEVSGYSQDEARERIASGGKLSDAKELKYAIFGVGTNEKTIREVMQGKSKAELEAIAADYKSVTGNDLGDDLHGDLSGRDEADMTLLLKTGDKTPEEKLGYLNARRDWELKEGTGESGMAFVGEEADVLNRTTAEAQRSYEEYQELKAHNPANDPRVLAAAERFDRWVGYGEKDVERHREELDKVTDIAATVGAIVAAAVVTIVTAGTAAPAVLAALAAVTATATSMAIKADMKGAAYGREDIVTDLVEGTAQAILAAATAGAGEVAFKALATRLPILMELSESAESSLLARIAVKGTESGIEGLIQGVPSGLVGAALNKETWNSSDPFAVFLKAGAMGGLQGMGMGAGMGAAFEGAGAAFKGKPTVGEPVKLSGGGGAVETPGTVRTEAPEAVRTQAPEVVRTQAPEAVRTQAPEVVRTQAPEVVRTQAPEAAATDTAVRPRPSERPSVRSPGEPEETPKLAETEKTEKTPRTAAPEKTEEVPTEPEPPEADLPEGSIMHGDTLSAADAEVMYENTIRDTPGREALVCENVDTGERIVIQGDSDTVQASPQVWEEFAREQMGGGRWRTVKHNHPIDETGLTPVRDRYPSGRGGDLGGAIDEAAAYGQAETKTIDIVTERGAEQILYGYDPAAEKPIWVDIPGPTGERVRTRFKSLESYHEWYEQQTGLPLYDVAPAPVASPTAEGAAGPKAAAPGTTEAPKPAATEAPEGPATETPKPAATETPPRSAADVGAEINAKVKERVRLRGVARYLTEQLEGVRPAIRNRADQLQRYLSREIIPRYRGFDWAANADFQIEANRVRLQTDLAKMGDGFTEQLRAGEARSQLNTLEQTAQQAARAEASFSADLAKAQSELAGVESDLSTLRTQNRVLADIALSPKLTEPPDMNYMPKEIAGATEAQRMSQVRGYQAEIRLANKVVDELDEAVVKYGATNYGEGRHGADVISVGDDGSVTLWDSKHVSGGTSHPASDTFTDPGRRASAVAEAKNTIAASDLPEPVRDQALKNLNKGNFKAITATTNDVGMTFHHHETLEFQGNGIVAKTSGPGVR